MDARQIRRILELLERGKIDRAVALLGELAASLPEPKPPKAPKPRPPAAKKASTKKKPVRKKKRW